MDRLIYDIEIANAIPGKNKPNLDGVAYCKGWGDFEGMGIAVIGAKLVRERGGFPRFSYHSQPYLSADDFFNTIRLSREENDFKVVGFNSKNFDDKLLAANGIKGVRTDYDLLEEVRIAAGFWADYRSVPKSFTYNLDALAKANNMAKTGHGALAPILWQQGKKKEVIDYCLNDVEITSKILDLGLAGELIDPNTNEKLKLRTLNG